MNTDIEGHISSHSLGAKSPSLDAPVIIVLLHHIPSRTVWPKLKDNDFVNTNVQTDSIASEKLCSLEVRGNSICLLMARFRKRFKGRRKFRGRSRRRNRSKGSMRTVARRVFSR